MAQNINPFVQDTSNQLKNNESTKNRHQDNHAVAKRLQKELMCLMMSSEKNVSAFPEGENIFKWVATISGPEGTVFEGKTYKLSLEFPNSYPYAAPLVKFTTPCFHPNIDMSGNICLDILKEKWSALYDVRTILLSLQSMLGERDTADNDVWLFVCLEPNIESPLNTQAAELWSNQEEYKKYLDKSTSSTPQKNLKIH